MREKFYDVSERNAVRERERKNTIKLFSGFMGIEKTWTSPNFDVFGPKYYLVFILFNLMEMI